MKIMTVVGTRPEVIRLSRVIALLDRVSDHVLVHTGQNWDPLLNEVFFSELEIRPADHVLKAVSTSLGGFLGSVLPQIEHLIALEQPDAFLVLGDTNSSITALMAKRAGIPVYHMEAGNRCFDENVPEETNRRLVDHIADFNIAYTEHARRNLLAEGLPARRVAVTGSPMLEVLTHYNGHIENSKCMEEVGVEPAEYFLASIHREENVDSPTRLRRVLDCLDAVQAEWDLPIIVSTHPRTRKRIDDLDGFVNSERIRFLKPFGFFDYIKLQRHARCVLSDSGTISEESAILGFPAITLRDAIERPEALESGTILMTGLNVEEVVANIHLAIEARQSNIPVAVPGYDVGDTARRTVNFILSTVYRHADWSGRRPT